MQLGASLPVVDIGTGPSAIRDYAQSAEALGYAYLVAPDHVLGVNPAADTTAGVVGRGVDAEYVVRRHQIGIAERFGGLRVVTDGGRSGADIDHRQ